MTFDAFETSSQLGRPIEIFTFTQGSLVFRFTNATHTVTFGGEDFTPEQISHGPLQITQERREGGVTVTVPTTNSFAKQYIGIQPPSVGTLKIEVYHANDPALQLVSIFDGKVQAVSFTNNGYEAEITLQPVAASLNRLMPQKTFQSRCNHQLFDVRCKVVQANFEYVGNVSAVSADGKTLTVDGLNAAKGVDWATGGFVSLATTGDFRLALSHGASDAVEIIVPFPGTIVGTSVTVAAGCDRSIETCKSKFDNVENFLGFHAIPLRDITRSELEGAGAVAGGGPKGFFGTLG